MFECKSPHRETIRANVKRLQEMIANASDSLQDIQGKCQHPEVSLCECGGRCKTCRDCGHQW